MEAFFDILVQNESKSSHSHTVSIETMSILSLRTMTILKRVTVNESNISMLNDGEHDVGDVVQRSKAEEEEENNIGIRHSRRWRTLAP